MVVLMVIFVIVSIVVIVFSSPSLSSTSSLSSDQESPFRTINNTGDGMNEGDCMNSERWHDAQTLKQTSQLIDSAC